jgi:uncharacterized protein (DUF1778 family)
MRTTVTLDPDVEKLLRRAARQRDQSFKTVLNAAIRRGLSVREKSKRFRQKTFRMGATSPGANLTKALALAAGIEDAEIIRKLEAGK